MTFGWRGEARCGGAGVCTSGRKPDSTDKRHRGVKGLVWVGRPALAEPEPAFEKGLSPLSRSRLTSSTIRLFPCSGWKSGFRNPSPSFRLSRVRRQRKSQRNRLCHAPASGGRCFPPCRRRRHPISAVSTQPSAASSRRTHQIGAAHAVPPEPPRPERYRNIPHFPSRVQHDCAGQVVAVPAPEAATDGQRCDLSDDGALALAALDDKTPGEVHFKTQTQQQTA
jgi:hypothetical protein